MPFDGLVTRKVCEEYNEKILYGKIDKIIQPSKDEVVLFIRNNRTTYKLLLCINAQNARSHLTKNTSIINPSKPFNFCMVLRKYLLGAKLVSVSQIDNDRIINFTFENSNELGDKETKTLIIEIMGKHSNIILTTKKGTIVDSIKHVDFEMSSVREVMPGRQYILPLNKGKVNPFNITEEDFYTLISKKHSLSDNFSGLSSLLNEKQELYNYAAFTDFLKQKSEAVICLNNSEIKDFYFTSLKITDTEKSYDSISDAIDIFYDEKLKTQKINNKKNTLLSAVNSNIYKVQKKLSIAEEKISTTTDMDLLKKYGELLQSNLYKITPFSKEVTVEDYYNNCAPLTIKLDPSLTASQNIQKIFKKYTKLKNTLLACSSQKEQLQTSLKYLESLIFEIQFLTNIENLEEIEKELSQEGFIKIQKSKKACVKSTFLQFNYMNFIIYVGKNNIQNDKLTFSVAHKSDIWFHAKNVPGAHTILKTNNVATVPQDVLEFAASLAAFYSKLSSSPKVDIDYTEVRNVKKIPGAKPGMVIYENYKTIYIKPNDGQTFSYQSQQ